MTKIDNSVVYYVFNENRKEYFVNYLGEGAIFDPYIANAMGFINEHTAIQFGSYLYKMFEYKEHFTVHVFKLKKCKALMCC